MAGRIAEPLFKTGAEDKLTVEDVYQIESGPQTPTTNNSINQDIINTATPPQVFDGGVLKSNITPPVMSNQTLTERAEDTLGSEQGVLDSLGEIATDVLLGTVTTTEAKQTDYFYNTDGVRHKKAPETTLDQIKTISLLTEGLFGSTTTSGVRDSAMEFGLTQTLVNEMTSAGTPSLLTDLTNKVADKGGDAVGHLTESALSVVGDFTKVDYSTVAALLDILDGFDILTVNPDSIRQILSIYRLPFDFIPANTATELSLLKSQLAQIDPQWFRKSRDGVQVYNLEPFQYASTDAEFLLMQDEILSLPMRICKTYPRVPLNRRLRADRRRAAIKGRD
ncbi:hypothetical protein [Endozoicomonas sp. ONNA1]|uniref:hypothetical protein n=1 Tax=Endozoicomonas sp. ONNA1 TaxID=2828740 RepID=UPI002148E93E|nr:hypothetical protein [Endozoicomonas sp. ONNA1]